jgi:LPS export ABC transporter protein LptC
MSRRGPWVLVGALAAASLFILWVLLRGPTGEPQAAPVLRRTAATPQPTPTARGGQIPPVEAEQTTITTADDKGRKQWEMHADVVVVDSASNTAQLTKVRGIYFQKGGLAVTFTAPRGVFYIQTRNVALVDGVRAAAASGRTIDARQVTWHMKTQLIEAVGAVVLRQKGLTVRADRMTTDLKLTNAKLEGNVRVDVVE